MTKAPSGVLLREQDLRGSSLQLIYSAISYESFTLRQAFQALPSLILTDHMLFFIYSELA